MNYKRIFSKTSLISSSSSKSIITSEEVAKLRNEIDTLKQTIEDLKLTIESRDAAIGTLAREKEKLYVELKTVQRTNRNIHQQLEDERNIHSKEKDFLIEEIKRFSVKNERFCSANANEDNIEYNLLKEEIITKDEVICNICTKYMKMKMNKMLLLDELRKYQIQSEKACEDVIIHLQESKKSLDELLYKVIEYCQVPPSSKHFLKVLRTNANLHFENTQLKVRLLSSASFQFANSNYFEDRKNNFEILKLSKSKHETRIQRQSRNSSCLNIVEHDNIKTLVKTLSLSTEDMFLKSHSDSYLQNLGK